MNFHTIWALFMRHTYLYRRSLPRLIELAFWPVMDLLVWGFLTRYLTSGNHETPSDRPILFLIGAMIFWDILFRAQQGVSLSVLEDIWTRNLLNIFVAPVRIREFVAATFLVGLGRIAIITCILATIALSCYGFDLFSVGWPLLPLFANLLIMGWSLGLVSTALIIRYGQSVEALAWAVPFLIQPISCVFYPLSALPVWLRPVALALPSTHAFEGMRQALAGTFPTGHLVAAFGLNVLYAIAAGIFFWRMFEAAKNLGHLSKLGTQ